MKRQSPHRAAVNLDWQHRSGDSTNTAYPLPYDVPKLRTHGTASLVRRCDKEAQQPPLCALVGCGFFLVLAFFFLSLFEPSFCCSEQFPPSTSRPDSGVEQSCRLDAARWPASDLRQQVLAAATIRHLYARPYALLYVLEILPLHLAASTHRYASNRHRLRTSLRAATHSRRARGIRLALPVLQLPQRSCFDARQPAVSRPPSILSQSVDHCCCSIQPHRTCRIPGGKLRIRAIFAPSSSSR
ncbi:hypothetical protein J3F83DRAFT_632174 [Trichoderma novae-zelandiae]